MSLNDISMPPRLVADLYHNALIDGSSNTRLKKKADYLGKNEKGILILVSHKKTSFLPDKELVFLTTVLAACQLTVSDVAIINHEHYKEDGAAILESLLPKQILFLGVLPEALHFSNEKDPYAVQKAGAVEYVAAPPLTEIEKTKQAKSQLWLALKQLFCL